jgi:acetyl-CoA acetyltransferase
LVWLPQNSIRNGTLCAGGASAEFIRWVVKPTPDYAVAKSRKRRLLHRMGLTAEALHNNLKFLEKIKMSLFTTHMKALKAQADGKFDKIVPITVDQTFYQ